MGLFSIGASRSESSSSSESSSFENLDQFGFDLSRSESGSQSSQRIDFRDVFADLFRNASGAAGRLASGPNPLTQATSLLFNSGTQFLERLTEGGAGADFLEEQLASEGFADDRIDLLEGDIEKFLTETVLPGITSSGVQAGTLGGGRGDVARGIAGEAAIKEFARGSTQIRLDEQARRDAIARDLLTSEATRSTAGLQALPGLAGLAESGFLAELSPYLILSQIIGDPTVLTESESAALATGIGAESTRGRGGSQSSSRSSSSGGSFSLGL